MSPVAAAAHTLKNSPTSAPAAALPLRSTVFERYMFMGNRPHEPMAFQIRLRFSGRIEPESFREALREAIARHPFLSARLQGESIRNLVWVAGDDTLHFDCQETGAPLHYPVHGGIDLRHEPGLRTWVRFDEQGTEIRFQFHHSCCDGIGAYQFIDEVLCRYHQRIYPEQPVPLKVVRPELLSQRGRFGLPWWRRLLRLPLTIFAVIDGGSRFYLQSPVEIALPPRQPPDETELQAVVDMPVATLTREQVSRLSQIAKLAGVTFNDLLVREFLRALRSWNELATGRPLEGKLSLIVPINLRDAVDEDQPAVNIVGMVPIYRDAKALADPRKLLRWLSREMTYFKRLRLGVEFSNVIAVIEWWFGSLKPLLDMDRCNTTAIFSNVGRVFSDSPLPREGERLRVGDMLLESVESAPPVRPHTPISFTTLSYQGSLSIVMNYSRLAMTAQSARQIVDHVAEQLRNPADA